MAVEYCPSSVRLAVSEPLVTVRVPLRWLEASVKGFRCPGTEGDVHKVDLLDNAARRSEAGDQTLQRLRRIELEDARGHREADRRAGCHSAANHLHRPAVDRRVGGLATGRHVISAWRPSLVIIVVLARTDEAL